MANIQHELMLTNITFQIVSDELNKVPVTDPLGKVKIADGKYNIRLGALTNAQFAELHAFCVLAGIYVADFTAIGDSYRTMVVCGISITSIGMDGLFVIPDRKQNPHMTIKLSHIPGTDWIDLVSIKPYSGEDEKVEMRSIIDELKEFADKIGIPVVTAEQPKISDRVTLHGVILRNITKLDCDVVKFTFDNVSNEDLDALVELYDDHPLMNRPMDRYPLTFNTKGDKHVVTFGIYTIGDGYKSYTPRDTPIDITLELHKGTVNPVIYDVILAEDKQPVDSNIKKEECVMSERTHTIELKHVMIGKGVMPEGCDKQYHIALKIVSTYDDVHKRIFKMYEDCPICTPSNEKRRYMPSRDGNETTVVIFVPDADEIDMDKVYDYSSNITLSLDSLLIPGSTLINAVVKNINIPGIGEWDGLPKKQHEEAARYVQAIYPESDTAKKLEESIQAISANPGETIWIDSLGCNNKTKTGGTTMRRTSISIEKLFFNGSTTIVMWTDGTKTVVRPIEGEKFDPEIGIAMAIARKIFGSRHQFDKFVDEKVRDLAIRNAKAFTDKELATLIVEKSATIADAKKKHAADKEAYNAAKAAGEKKLPVLSGLKSDRRYRYAKIMIDAFTAEREERKRKKAARVASTKKDAKKPTTARKPSTRKKKSEE